MQSAAKQGLVIVGNSAVLKLGFRPFFAGAAIFSLLSSLLWLGIYVSGWSWQPGGLAAVS